MITREQLAAACRAHDNAIDIGEGVHDIWKKRGANARDVTYVAQQRALRLILSMRGETLDMTRLSDVKLSPIELNLYERLAAAWMDGLAVGIHVTQER
jgi:hypothetical protein